MKPTNNEPLNQHSTLEEIKARVTEIITTPGGLMDFYAEKMGTKSPEETRREFFNQRYGYEFQGVLCRFRLFIDGWKVDIGRDFSCSDWRIRARFAETNEQAGSSLYCPSCYTPLESYLSDFLGVAVFHHV